MITGASGVLAGHPGAAHVPNVPVTGALAGPGLVAAATLEFLETLGEIPGVESPEHHPRFVYTNLSIAAGRRAGPGPAAVQPGTRRARATRSTTAMPSAPA